MKKCTSQRYIHIRERRNIFNRRGFALCDGAVPATKEQSTPLLHVGLTRSPGSHGRAAGQAGFRLLFVAPSSGLAALPLAHPGSYLLISWLAIFLLYCQGFHVFVCVEIDSLMQTSPCVPSQHLLDQWLSTRDSFAAQGTFGNVWRHL